jgi:hypothetical protein
MSSPTITFLREYNGTIFLRYGTQKVSHYAQENSPLERQAQNSTMTFDRKQRQIEKALSISKMIL